MLKVSDLVSGLAIAGLGIFIFVQSRSFPAIGNIGVAPSFYPGLIGVVLALCGLALAGTALLRGAALPLFVRPAWFSKPANVVAVLAVPASIVAYGLLSPRIGFLATSFLVASGLLLAFRVRVLTSLITAFLVTVALYLIFAITFRVPLPYGVIERLLP